MKFTFPIKNRKYSNPVHVHCVLITHLLHMFFTSCIPFLHKITGNFHYQRFADGPDRIMHKPKIPYLSFLKIFIQVNLFSPPESNKNIFFHALPPRK